MIQLNITDELIKRLKAIGLNSENFGSALVALIALNDNDIHLLDVMDDHSKERRAFFLYQNLVRVGLVEQNEGGDTYYRLTDGGKAFVNSLAPKVPKVVESNVEEWIDSWVNLFPEGVESGGKLLRSDRKSCLTKMVQFLKDYPEFDKETIFKATERYLDGREKENWAYTRCAVYFINKKGEGSDLASACSNESNSKEETVESGMI